MLVQKNGIFLFVQIWANILQMNLSYVILSVMIVSIGRLVFNVKWLKFIAIATIIIVLLSACSTVTNTKGSLETESTTKQDVVNTTPVASSGDLSGIWTGRETTEAGYIGYLYFCSNGVYYMASKVGKPSSTDFTSDYRLASNYSVSANDSGETVCEFGGYTATVYSKSRLSFRGDSYQK